MGSSLVEIETYWEDSAERSTTNFGYVSSVLAGSMVRFARGMMVGSEPGEFDLAVVAGDITGSILFSPAAILRDMANSTERLIYTQPTGDDALNLALGLTTIAGALFKGKAGAFLQIGKLAKALPAGSRASRAVARLIALETKLAATAEGVSRVRKLVEMAQMGSGVAQMVGGVLDVCGVHVAAIEALNSVMANAPEPTETLGALVEVQGELAPQDFRQVLLAAGSPVGETSSGSQGTGAVAKLWLSVNRQFLQGAKDSVLLLAAVGKRDAGTWSRRIVRQFGVGAQFVFENLHAYKNKGAENLEVLLARMASKSARTREGAKFAYEFAVSRIGIRAGVAFERFQEIPIAGGRSLRRWFDVVVDGVYYECKHWTFPFPPPMPAPGDARGLAIYKNQWRAIRTAGKQWLRDIVFHVGQAGVAGIPQRMRYVFPRSMKPFEAALKGYFRMILKSPSLKRLMVADPSNLAQMRRYDDAIAMVLAQIDTIIVFHP